MSKNDLRKTEDADAKGTNGNAATCLRAVLSPRNYDKGMDCYVLRASSPEILAARELIEKMEGGEA